MRFRRPRPALFVAGIALFVLAAGAAYAASAKPDRASTSAALSSSSGSGIKPSNFFHAAVTGLTSGGGCIVIARPAEGQALIVTQVRLNTFADPTPGGGNGIFIFTGSPNVCDGSRLVGSMNPATIGEDIVTFDPGLGIPAGSALNVFVGGSVSAEAYTDGFVVAAKQVPLTTTISQTGTNHPQQ
jgi:hypothetical protein